MYADLKMLIDGTWGEGTGTRRVEVLNPAKSVFGADNKVVVPPSGIIAGVFARSA